MNTGQADELLTATDVADLWQVRVDWVYDMVQAHRIPFIRVGRQLRFRRDDLDAWVEKRTVRPGEPIQ